MSEITIVTAFFDIGRKHMEGFSRDSNTYLNYFKFWARINNKMIIYVDSNLAEEVKNIRSNFNLDHKTTVIPIDDFKQLVPDSYLSIKKGLSHPLTKKFRKNPKAPEAYNPEYTYITFLKPWLVQNAIEKGLTSGMIAWVDFGYNHGGKTYINSEEFNFTWNYDFSDKIHLFHLNSLNNLPIFEVVRQMPVDISAGVIIAPSQYWKILVNSFVDSIHCLAKCDLSDDEQTLLLMSYRESPNYFELHRIPSWFSVFKSFGGEHLTIDSMSNYKFYKQQSILALNAKNYLKALSNFCIYSYKKIKYRLFN